MAFGRKNSEYVNTRWGILGPPDTSRTNADIAADVRNGDENRCQNGEDANRCKNDRMSGNSYCRKCQRKICR